MLKENVISPPERCTNCGNPKKIQIEARPSEVARVLRIVQDSTIIGLNGRSHGSCLCLCASQEEERQRPKRYERIVYLKFHDCAQDQTKSTDQNEHKKPLSNRDCQNFGKRFAYHRFHAAALSAVRIAARASHRLGSVFLGAAFLRRNRTVRAA